MKPGGRAVKGLACSQGSGRMSCWCSEIYGIHRPNAEGPSEVEVPTQKGPWYVLSREYPLCPLEEGLHCCLYSNKLFFFEDFIYLFDRERHSERGDTSRDRGRGRLGLPAEQGARRGTL